MITSGEIRAAGVVMTIATPAAPPTIPCPYCTREIGQGARKCPECLSDLAPKSRFNLEGWSRIVAFVVALITVTSLGADKLSLLFLTLTGRDGASRLTLELIDARFKPPGQDGKPAELDHLIAMVTNFGYGAGLLYPQFTCLAEDLSKTMSTEVLTWVFRLDQTLVVDAGKATHATVKAMLSPGFLPLRIPYPSREYALAQWSEGGKLQPKDTCRLSYGDRRGYGSRRFTAPQQMLSAIQDAERARASDSPKN